MSTWSKGSKAEKEVCDKLEVAGWVTRRWNKTRFGEQDVWGCDIIAIKDGYMRFIQVKSCKGRIPAKTKEAISHMEPLLKHKGNNVTVEWWGINTTTGDCKTVTID